MIAFAVSTYLPQLTRQQAARCIAKVVGEAMHLNTCLFVVQLFSGYVGRNLAVGAGIQKAFDEWLLLGGPCQLEQAMRCCLDSIAYRSKARMLGHHQNR